MRVLVTGGAGFIGSHLAEALHGRGDEVIVLDNLSTGDRANLARLEGKPGFQFVEGSDLDADLLSELVRASDTVVHLAAAVGVFLIMRRPYESLHGNVVGTANVIEACARWQRRTIIASSSEIYGKSDDLPLREQSNRVLSSTEVIRWSYSSGKAVEEHLAFASAVQNGLPVSAVRFFNVVGPRQSPAYGMALPRFVTQALSGEDLTVFGDGTQTRTFCYVSDLVTGLLALLARPCAIGTAINLGSSQEISMLDLARKVIGLTGSRSKIRFVPYEEVYGPGYEDIARRVPDLTKAQAEIGYDPRWGIDDIIRAVVADQRGGPASGPLAGPSGFPVFEPAATARGVSGLPYGGRGSDGQPHGNAPLGLAASSPVARPIGATNGANGLRVANGANGTSLPPAPVRPPTGRAVTGLRAAAPATAVAVQDPPIQPARAGSGDSAVLPDALTAFTSLVASGELVVPDESVLPAELVLPVAPGLPEAPRPGSLARADADGLVHLSAMDGRVSDGGVNGNVWNGHHVNETGAVDLPEVGTAAAWSDLSPSTDHQSGRPVVNGRAVQRATRVSVVIPVFNEERSVAEVIRRIRSQPLDVELIVVDDGSTDGTARRLAEVADLVDIVITLPDNGGKGAAVRAGMVAANQEVIVLYDADLEMDVSVIGELIEPILDGRADFVNGSRVHDENSPYFSAAQWWGNRALTAVVRVLYGKNVEDIASAAKAFRRSTALGMQLTSDRFDLESEIIAKVIRMRARIVEIPVAFRPRARREGKKVRLSDGLLAIRTLIRNRFWSPKGAHAKLQGGRGRVGYQSPAAMNGGADQRRASEARRLQEASRIEEARNAASRRAAQDRMQATVREREQKKFELAARKKANAPGKKTSRTKQPKARVRLGSQRSQDKAFTHFLHLPPPPLSMIGEPAAETVGGLDHTNGSGTGPTGLGSLPA